MVHTTHSTLSRDREVEYQVPSVSKSLTYILLIMLYSRGTISFHTGRHIQMHGEEVTTKMNQTFCIQYIPLQLHWIQKVVKYMQDINTRQ